MRGMYGKKDLLGILLLDGSNHTIYPLTSPHLNNCGITRLTKFVITNMSYIQDNLLEKHICRFNDGECNCDCYIAGMTDYHNHIVQNLYNELVRYDPDKTMYSLDEIMKILQDTNPKE